MGRLIHLKLRSIRQGEQREFVQGPFDRPSRELAAIELIAPQNLAKHGRQLPALQRRQTGSIQRFFFRNEYTHRALAGRALPA
jgi:hypothetical protein